jgi:hypothetical protein
MYEGMIQLEKNFVVKKKDVVGFRLLEATDENNETVFVLNVLFTSGEVDVIKVYSSQEEGEKKLQELYQSLMGDIVTFDENSVTLRI